MSKNCEFMSNNKFQEHFKSKMHELLRALEAVEQENVIQEHRLEYIVFKFSKTDNISEGSCFFAIVVSNIPVTTKALLKYTHQYL